MSWVTVRLNLWAYQDTGIDMNNQNFIERNLLTLWNTSSEKCLQTSCNCQYNCISTGPNMNTIPRFIPSHKTVWSRNSFWRILKCSVPTAQETYCVYITKTDQLMPFREVGLIAVYYGDNTKLVNTLCGQNAVVFMLKHMVDIVTIIFKRVDAEIKGKSLNPNSDSYRRLFGRVRTYFFKHIRNNI
jgi:hypothetical protein